MNRARWVARMRAVRNSEYKVYPLWWNKVFFLMAHDLDKVRKYLYRVKFK
jgi:hypothetical protein